MFRKGAGNVEFIISFVLFVGFITTAIYFFNPVKDVRTVESLNNYVFDSIAQNSTIEMEFYSVKLIEQPDKCKNIVAVDIENSDGKIASVENYTGNELESGQSGDSVYLKKDGEQFVTIKFGEDLERGSLSGVPVDTSCYDISTYLKNKVLSEKRFLELNKTYYEDYRALKTALAIPDNADFSFAVEFSDSKITATRGKPLGTEVYSKTERREFLRVNGKNEFAYFTTAIW